MAGGAASRSNAALYRQPRPGEEGYADHMKRKEENAQSRSRGIASINSKEDELARLVKFHKITPAERGQQPAPPPQ